jgi:hypothetical protein
MQLPLEHGPESQNELRKHGLEVHPSYVSFEASQASIVGV